MNEKNILCLVMAAMPAQILLWRQDSNTVSDHETAFILALPACKMCNEVGRMSGEY